MLNYLTTFTKIEVLPELLIVKIAKAQILFLDLAHQQKITTVLFCLHNISWWTVIFHFHEDNTLTLQIYLPFAAIVFL